MTDAASTDATITLRDLAGGVITVFGTGTPYTFDVDGIKGLFTPESKANQSQVDGRDGVYAGPEFLGVRIITIPLVLLGSSPGDAIGGFLGLGTLWQPGRAGVDSELVFDLPGLDTPIGLFGRPNGGAEDVTQMKNSTLKVLLRFDANNPNFHDATLV